MSGSRVEDPAGGAGVLHQHAAQLAVRQAVGEVGDDDVDAHRRRRGCGRRRWSAAARRRRRRTGPVALLVPTAYERHRLGGRGALVEQRGVGRRQPGQVADHGLEVDQRLEPALGDLRLVRRVGGVPARVLEHVAADHRRRDRARGSRSRSSPRRAGSCAARWRSSRAAASSLDRLRQVEVARGADAAGDGGLHQRLERVVAQRVEHLLDVGGSQTDVAVDEGASAEADGSVMEAPWLAVSRRLPICRPGVGPSELPGPRSPGA